MISCSNKDNKGLIFKTNRPHFFKIILDHTIRDKKLGIPKKFGYKYGNDLSSSVILKVPSGAKWKVEIVKCDGDLWLQKGWQEFMEYYSITYKSLLVFEFDQKSFCFNVIIFDKSASEIDYPLNDHDNMEPNLEKESQETKIQETENDNRSVEILGHYSRCQKTKEKSPLPVPPPRKKMKLDCSTRQINPKCSAGQVKGGTGNETKNGKVNMCSQKQRLNRFPVRKRHLRFEAKAQAIQRASANFESENPYFMLVMQRSHVCPVAGKATLPASFAWKHLNKNNGNATLNVLDGRTWSVGYHTRQHRAGHRIAEITRGWMKFAEYNHLKVGDVCVFEMIKNSKTTNVVFKVAIYRETIAANCFTSLSNKTKLMNGKGARGEHFEKVSCSILSGDIEAAKKFTSVRPFLKVVITRAYMQGGTTLNVPLSFVMNLKQITYNTTFQVKDRRWPVKLKIYHRYRCGKFSAGWSFFARDNSLQVGDICIFELIGEETMLIKVSIFRHVE